jgi:hypothetical protein
MVRRAAIEGLEARRLLSANVLSYHQDAASTGQDVTETLLTPSNVNSTDFGRIFDTTLDGQVYAEPLAVQNVNITRGPAQGVHNVIYAATMHDSLFAIDATTGQILWQDNFTQIANPQVSTNLSPAPTAGVTTYPATVTDNALVSPSDISPELGILSTPVINSANNVIYLVTNTQELRNGSTPVATYSTGVDYHFVQRLWAINLSDGSVAITPNNPSVEPTAGGQVIGDVILDPTGSNTVPTFSNYSGYEYVAGPFIKGTGNNGGTNPDDDGWIVNPSDTTSPWGSHGQSAPQAGYIPFNSLQQMGRTALALIGGNIYFGYASHGDNGPYYGWLLGYNASTLTNVAAFNTVPTYEPFSVVSGDDPSYDAQGGIWGGGEAITTDGTNIYVAAGNGAFNPTTANFSSTYISMDGTHAVQVPLDNDYGNSAMKIAIDPSANQNGTPGSTYNPDNFDPNGYGLKVVDFFTPSNEFELNNHDYDLGSGGTLLIPASGPGYSNPDGNPMLVLSGKEGRVYLLDAGNLGGYNTAYITGGFEQTNQDPSGFDRVLGEFYYYESIHPGTNANNGTYQNFSTESYFNGNIYVGIGHATEWSMAVSSLLAATSPPPSGVYSTIAADSHVAIGIRGATATVSANGTANAVVWIANVSLSSTDYLLAFNASNMTAIYDSQTNGSRDSLPNNGTIPGTSQTGATGSKFSVPTVFNSMVYVGTGGGAGTSGVAAGTLVGYGLLPTFAATASNFKTPTNFTATPSSTASITLNWTSNSSDATEFEIDRSTNGGASTVLAYVAQTGSSAYQYIDNTTTAGNQYTYKVRAISGGTMTLPATGAATTASTTSFATVNTGTFAIKSGSTLNVYLGLGGAVTLTSTAGITATKGTSALSFSGITAIAVTDSATGDVLTITSAPNNPYTFTNTGNSTVNITAGTLTFAAVPGGSINLGALSISSGATAAITATTTSQPTTLNVTSLTIGATGSLDVANNVVVINYAGGTDPISTIAAELKSGFNTGTWNGPGINSSQAHLNSASYGLGYADSADAGNPTGLPSQTIEIMYTLLGDANLDAAVNGVDFGIVAANFNKSITAWDQGDFNYDSIDNGVDFGFLSANFNKGSNIAAAAPPANTTLAPTPSKRAHNPHR